MIKNIYIVQVFAWHNKKKLQSQLLICWIIRVTQAQALCNKDADSSTVMHYFKGALCSISIVSGVEYS